MAITARFASIDTPVDRIVEEEIAVLIARPHHHAIDPHLVNSSVEDTSKAIIGVYRPNELALWLANRKRIDPRTRKPDLDRLEGHVVDACDRKAKRYHHGKGPKE